MIQISMLGVKFKVLKQSFPEYWSLLISHSPVLFMNKPPLNELNVRLTKTSRFGYDAVSGSLLPALYVDP